MRESTNPKDKIGRQKPSLHLIPPTALIEEAVVMGLGSKKYGPYNWREKEVSATVYVSAAMRHLMQYLDGEDADKESGASHLAHARACLGILLDSTALDKLVDDRPPKGKATELLEMYSKITEPKEEPGADVFVNGPGTLCEYGQHRKVRVKDIKNTVIHYNPATHDIRLRQEPLRFYIAGPMRGYPAHNFPAFDRARNLGVSLGHKIISPADLDRESGFDPNNGDDFDLKEVIKRDIDAILTLDANRGDGVAVLPGWGGSTGARAEVALARWMGLKIVLAHDFETPVEFKRA